MKHPTPATLAVLALALAACDDGVEQTLRPDEPDAPLEAVETASRRAPGMEGYRVAPDEIRTGFIMGRDGVTPQEVTYEVYTGVAVWEGDIVLGPASTIPATREELLRLTLQRGQPDVPQGVVIDGEGFRWTNGIVPYEIDPALPSQSRVTDAIEMVEVATAGVDLVPRNGESDYVRFTTGDGCSSEIGRIGGQQDIILDDGCSTGNAAHEIIHALGLFHEHTRCDRDDFVAINEDQIEEGKEHNFTKNCDGATDYFDYDEGSIMHYGPFAFAIGDLPTISSLRGLEDEMGQRSELSEVDIQTINLLYEQFNDAPTAVIAPLEDSYPEGTIVAFDGSGSSDPDDEVLNFAWSFGDGTCTVATPPALCSQESPSKTYVDNLPDDAPYPVTLTVDDGYLSDVANAEARVTNVNPVVSAGADATLTSAETYNFSGSFVDAGIIDFPWEWEIDWGDGTTPTTGSTNVQSALIQASHQVCAAGDYTVTITVEDKDSGVGSDNLTLTVEHFAVVIDISPTEDPNPVSPSKKGLQAVAILSTATFDATDVDPSTVYLGDGDGNDTPVAQRQNGAWHATQEDVNGDGLVDMVLKFSIPALLANGDLDGNSTALVLTGFLNDGCTNFRGEGPIVVVPSD